MSERYWYEHEHDADDDGADGWLAVCREMAHLAENVDPGERPVWDVFAEFVRDTALDQELYGEAITADPALLDPMWTAFSYAWWRSS